MKKINPNQVKGKVVALRIDINLPVKEGEIQKNKRLIEHSKTIKELSENGAKLVVLGHQGKKGKDDFISLEKHAKLLREIIGKEILFMELENWDAVEDRINELKEGEILLLENLRFMEEETKNPFEAPFIERLSIPCDYFVLDALSVAHREHASVVGLTKHLKSYMGNVLESEVSALEKLKGSKKVTFVIGGAKVKDSVKIMKYWLESGNVEKILLGGAPATLFLKAKGIEIGKESEEYMEKINAGEFIQDVKEMIEKYSDKIEIPEDVVTDFEGRKEFSINEEIKGAIKDIGSKTSERYFRILEKAETIVMNGPMGVYEYEEFENGTKKVLQGIDESKGFSLIGGGHTTSAIQKFGIREDNFGYVSLSGKAFLQYLSGKELPGLFNLKGKG